MVPLLCPKNVERRRLANGDFPVFVFLHAALIGSFEIPQCTPSGYPDQWLSLIHILIGFDLNAARVEELSAGMDRTGEVDSAALQASSARFTSDPAALREAGVIIVAVPTPIDEHRNPDLSPVEGASRTVGRHLSRGAVVVYESTVYPGVTEEVCVPILEAESGLRCGADFTVGYSCLLYTSMWAATWNP